MIATNKEEKLQSIAHQMDNYIMMMVDEAKLDPLSVCAIMLARLTLTCDYLGCGENFRKLMIEAAAHEDKPSETLQ